MAPYYAGFISYLREQSIQINLAVRSPVYILLSVWMKLSFVVVVGALSQPIHGKVPTFSASQLQALRGLTCTNLEEVAASVDFSNPEVDPYPKLWYDLSIDYAKNCYVIFKSASDYSEYQLKSWTDTEFEASKSSATFLTHTGPCGVCSLLDDLNVYLDKTDLTTPVRRCALRFIGPLTLKCLRDLGFSKHCARIWFWNTQNTRKTGFRGGCLGTCMARIWTSNNQPTGTYNPCEPTEEIKKRNQPTDSATAAMTSEPTLEAASSSGTCISEKGDIDAKSKNEQSYRCGNTINGRPACSDVQWQNGPYRINPCLQCDECRSGPIFQKLAGRTRRYSGIESAIGRPGVPDLAHEYISNGILSGVTSIDEVVKI